MNSQAPYIKAKAEQYRRSFYLFLQDGYKQLGDIPFVDNWHIDVMCKSLQYLHEGKIASNSLLVCVPPSHMKSLTVSVIFPLWCWIQDPSEKFLFISYAESRSLEDAKRRRMIFNSEWFQKYFQIVLTQTGDNLQRLANTSGGFFYSTSVGGQITGEHSNYIICDDLQNAESRFSEVETKRVIDFYSNVLPSRFSDPRTGRKIVICQRLTDKDLPSYIEETGEPFEKIILPEIYDVPRYHSQFPELNDPREPGELLWAEKFGLPEILKLQFLMSKSDIDAQYQQRPGGAEGNIFRREWFKDRRENTSIIWRFLFVDSAFSLKKEADFTSILCAEITSEYKIFIRSVFRARLEFSDLIKEIKKQADRWQYNLQGIVIEAKGSGISAIQTLRESADTELANLIYEFSPKVSKEERAKQVSVWAEKQRVMLPPPGESFPWLLDFETELFSFPASKHDDMTDTFTMCLLYLEDIIADGFNATLPTQQEIMEDEYVTRM